MYCNRELMELLKLAVIILNFVRGNNFRVKDYHSDDSYSITLDAF